MAAIARSAASTAGVLPVKWRLCSVSCTVRIQMVTSAWLSDGCREAGTALTTMDECGARHGLRDSVPCLVFGPVVVSGGVCAVAVSVEADSGRGAVCVAE
jgi:hypothetical protein